MKKTVCILLIAACLFSLAACDGPVEVIPDMQQVYESMKTHLPAMEPFAAEAVLDAYGIDSAACKQMVVSSYYDGADTAEIWLIEAVDKSAAQQIEGLVQARLDSLSEQFLSYDPEAYKAVKDAQIITHATCVVLIIAEEAEDLAQIYKTAAQLR